MTQARSAYPGGRSQHDLGRKPNRAVKGFPFKRSENCMFLYVFVKYPVKQDFTCNLSVCFSFKRRKRNGLCNIFSSDLYCG